MKKILLMMSLLASMAGNVQERKYSMFYYQRVALSEKLPVTLKDIIFPGNNITDGEEWSELLNNKHVKNRGISGDICMGVHDRLDAILKGKPTKTFLLTGINDVDRDTSADTIVHRIGVIIQKIKQEFPKTKLYLQNVLSVTDRYKMFGGHTSRWREVKKVSEGPLRLTDREHVTYIDLYSHFVDEKTGKMNIGYTNDGLCLLGKGYLKWADIVKPYISKKWKRCYSYLYF